MILTEYIDTLASYTPAGWDFTYAIPELIYNYKGDYPLIFAHTSPARITYPSDASILRTYTQKISFMYSDREDSLGLKLKSTGVNEMIQTDDLSTVQNVVNNYLIDLRNDSSLNIRSVQENIMPRYRINGGNVLLGWELTLEIETLPISCSTA